MFLVFIVFNFCESQFWIIIHFQDRFRFATRGQKRHMWHMQLEYASVQGQLLLFCNIVFSSNNALCFVESDNCIHS